MVQINWTFQAKYDLNSIAEFISKDSKKYAELQIIKLRNRTKILKTQPYSGKLVPEINQPEIRELIEGNYRIIYKIVNDLRIDILTVHHSARNFKGEKL
ncbi:type II toxin-antitoxin system RelE/ParE family toxin [Salegentibacter sp. LM13S]|uniref:type II toxin-antitoxin system RelE/ParE family toxin n=1 Tax=Salegentibacter lacus TaxID=2873599 RepID=UPI001CCFF01D|nr:type II toxin-antitoxin system RelE/ParE family toxin [Salegentibacter lacus]MBZ9632071.1 type II toxin-antitoxin system RelE/ParE family toxin [Salegentibacter lacus]